MNTPYLQVEKIDDLKIGDILEDPKSGFGTMIHNISD